MATPGPTSMRWRFAWVLVMTWVGAAACGFVPAETPNPYRPPPPKPAPVSLMAAETAARRPVLLGQVCPDAADGRPAVMALVARRERVWIADPDELRKIMARGRTGRFAVLSFEGKRAATFTPMAAIDLGTRWPSAMGGLAGAGACEAEAAVKARDPAGAAARSAECTTALGTCGLALAVVGGDPDEVIEPQTGGACLEGGNLVAQIDVTGGAVVGFPVEAFVGRRGLADEVSGKPGVKVTPACTMRFARGGIDSGAKTGRAADLLGVVDLDGDGRREVIVQLREGARRTWGVYTASQSSARLKLVALAVPTER